MYSRTFISLTPARIAECIDAADTRVIFGAPGADNAVAQALLAAITRLGEENVRVLLDVDDEVCRIGYGFADGFRLLNAAGHKIFSAPGLRIGFLVCDDQAWTFAPTPLCVEEPTSSDKKPNAIACSPEQAVRMADAVLPQPEEPDQPSQAEPTTAGPAAGQDESPEQDESLDGQPEGKPAPKPAPPREPEIGKVEVRPEQIAKVEKRLEENPPQKFEIARKVRVFDAQIEFVELVLEGCKIKAMSVSIPQELLSQFRDEGVKANLRTRYKLIDEADELTGASMEQEIKEIRDTYTRSLGKKLGVVLLRQRKQDFERALAEFEKKLVKFRATFSERMQEMIPKAIDGLVQELLPGIVERPPKGLRGQVRGTAPTAEEARRYINSVLEREIPKPDDLVGKMALSCVFKGVTYEMLKQEEFQKAVREKFPAVDWDKPFEEYDAAPASGPTSPA